MSCAPKREQCSLFLDYAGDGTEKQEQCSGLGRMLSFCAFSCHTGTMTSPAKAPGVRARVRAELTAEIKAAARRQLASEGASSLSLRAIAREMDMASSAIYRYFASRDELLTALIIDAYEAIGDAAATADKGCDPSAYRQRCVAVSAAVRSWAVANPHEYGLIYGSPVPGYAAPQDTIDPATRVPTVLLGILIDYVASTDPDSACLLYTSPSPRDATLSRMPSSA